MKSANPEVRNRAAKLVESGWTKGTPARDASDRAICPLETRAVKWCATGAIERACWEAIGEKPLATEADWDRNWGRFDRTHDMEMSVRNEVESELELPLNMFNDLRCHTKEQMAAVLRGEAGMEKKSMTIDHMGVRNRAAELVEKGWTTMSLARDNEDQHVSPLDAAATKWCARGAINRAYWEAMGERPFETQEEFCKRSEDRYVLTWRAHIVVEEVEATMDGTADLTVFNDRVAATKEQVAAVLRGERRTA